VARKLGFRLDRQKGSHAVYRREADGVRIVIPMHPGRAIRPGTLMGILDDLELTVERFRELL
jgi:predicted RNA binding protein YcfA (HicA-like mRNA interferase family)